MQISDACRHIGPLSTHIILTYRHSQYRQTATYADTFSLWLSVHCHIIAWTAE